MYSRIILSHRLMWVNPSVDLAEVEVILRDLPQVPSFEPEFTETDVVGGLKRLDLHKARGPDQWSNF